MHEVHSYLWCDAAKFKEIGIPVEDNVQLANTMSPGPQGAAQFPDSHPAGHGGGG